MEVRNVVFFLFLGASSLILAEGQTKAMMYLSQFGYLPPSVRNPSSGMLLSEEAMTDAIKEFQAFAGLNVTGELDDDTQRTMSLPRCGVKDKVGFGTDARSKRFALQGETD
nr:matrix metalloproteinase-14-like [Halyomorpha halys]